MAKQMALWSKLQQRIRQSITTTDALDSPIRLVGGLDISFSEDGSAVEQQAVAALVVLSLPELEMVYEDMCLVPTPEVEYAAGYLAFRECPAYSQLLERVKQTRFMPQVFLVDGCGMLHPRGCGSACHLGVQQDVPCIGVSKNLLYVPGGLTNGEVQQQLRAMWDVRCGDKQAFESDKQQRGAEGASKAPQRDLEAGTGALPTAFVVGSRDYQDLEAHAGCSMREVSGGTHLPSVEHGIRQTQTSAWTNSTQCIGPATQQGLRVSSAAALPGADEGTSSHTAAEGKIPELACGNSKCCVVQLPGHIVLDGLKDTVSAGGTVQGDQVAIPGGTQVLGAALSVRPYQRPVYVSIGHRISLHTAVRIVAQCCRYRIPEPIRQADIRSRQLLRQLQSAQLQSRSTLQ